MTKQLCRDCKHLETDGMFGIFCGVGGDNTKYDCPKYEEVIRMTEKRFKISIGELEEENISDTVKNIEITEISDMCTQMNTLYEENERLKSEYKVLHTQYQDLKKFVENNFDEHLTQEKLNGQIIKLSDENEQLKKDREELFIRERDTKNEWRELKQENTILKREYETLLKLVLDSGIDYSISDELEGLE